MFFIILFAKKIYARENDVDALAYGSTPGYAIVTDKNPKIVSWNLD